ncbi:tetratricopeptide repeat protein [Aurantivibrio plasticivorans]
MSAVIEAGKHTFCQYHPSAAATFHCPHCDVSQCDHCIDEGEDGTKQSCFLCHKGVESLGAANHATPFWRRLQESFRYPLSSEAIAVVVGAAVLSSLLLYLPLGFIWYLMLTGAFLKYCFSALENTSQGLLVAPDISEAYGGGITLLLRMLVIPIVMAGMVGTTYRFLGPQMAGLVGFLLVLGLPAILIIFGMTDSLNEALNPANIIKLVTSIGLPYGLILGFIMIMTASVASISGVVGDNLGPLSAVVQSAISNYYMLVMFHIMGYMIFQYQGELGFNAREDHGDFEEPRSPRDRLAANIDVELKEGNYNQVVALLDKALAQFPNDKEFQKNYFEFIFATNRLQVLGKVATRYLDFLSRGQEEHQLAMVYRRVLEVMPDFIPGSASARHRLAQNRLEKGEAMVAIKLLNGMHKAHPDYAQLPEAVGLMADALDLLPKKEAAAKQCRLLAKQLAAQRKQQLAKPAAKPKGAKRPSSSSLPFGSRANPSTEPSGIKANEPGGLSLVPMEEKSAGNADSSQAPVNETDAANGDLPPIEFK